MADKKICPLLLSRIGGDDLVKLAAEGVMPRREIAECVQGECAWWMPLVEGVIAGGPLPGGACALFVLAYDAAQRLARAWTDKKSGVEYHVGSGDDLG